MKEMNVAEEFEKAVNRLNDLLNMMGYSTYRIVDAEKQIVFLGEDGEREELTFADMVREAEDYLNWYYDDSTSYYELKEEDPKQWKSETMKWRNFIRKYNRDEYLELKPIASKPAKRGGKREGAGRKKGDKKQIAFWINEEEKAYLQKCLEEYRNKKQV